MQLDSQDVLIAPEPTTIDAQRTRPQLNGNNQIRVLSIQRSEKHNDPVRCNFVVTALESPVRYSTLSYAWGPIHADGSHLDDTIICDGHSFPATSHLTSALKRIRQVACGYDKTQDRWYCLVWADAICINQDDPIERSQQVRMMHRIFASSDQLFIWLGEHVKDVTELNGKLASSQGIEVKGNTSGMKTEEYGPMCRRILRNPWFERKWVIQEILVNTGCRLILTGDQVMNLDHFADAVHRLSLSYMAGPLREWRLVENGSYDIRSNRGVEYSTHSGHEPHPQQSRSLLSLLQLYTRARCSDPQDHVYALINLSTDLTDFEVDYTENVPETYYRVAMRYLGEADLPILLDCAASREPDKHRPSWVPDWSRPISYGSRHGPGSYPSPIDQGRFGYYRDKVHVSPSGGLVLEGRVADHCRFYGLSTKKACGRASCFYCRLVDGLTGLGYAQIKASVVFLQGVKIFFIAEEITTNSSSLRNFGLVTSRDIELCGRDWEAEAASCLTKESFELC
jgi:hypothetical protein